MINNLIHNIPIHMIGTNSATVLDASGEYQGQIFTALETATVYAINAYFSTVTTGGNIRASLCEIDSSVQPAIAGAILGSTTAYGITNVTGTGWKQFVLNTPLSITRGQLIMLKLDYETYTTQNMRPANVVAIRISDTLNYNLTYTGGSYVAAATNALDSYLETSDASLIATTLPPYYSVAFTFNSGSTADEYGNIFTAPGMIKVIGATVAIDIETDTDIKLYANGSTYTVSLVANMRSGTARGLLNCYFDTEVTIEKGTTFRISAVPGSTTNDEMIECYYPTGFESKIQTKYFGGMVVSKTSRADAGSWTDDTTKFIGIYPIISAFKSNILRTPFNGVCQ